MAEKTPAERAARALGNEYADAALCNHTLADVRAALTMAVEDREGLARALHVDDIDHGRAAARWEAMDPDAQEWYRDQANAVARWLTGDS